MAADRFRHQLFSAGVRVMLQGEFLKDVEDTTEIPEENRKRFHRILKGLSEEKVLLDAVIGKLSTVPLKKMRPKLLLILELSLYEILFLRTEDHAAVNEYVKLCEKTGFYNLKSFVNAILRRAVRERDTLFSGLSLREQLSIPEEIYSLLASWYDEETLKQMFSKEQEETVRPVVRRMVSRCDEDIFFNELQKAGVSAEKTGLTADTYYVSDIGKAVSSEAFKNGFFYVQDTASALCIDCVSDLLVKANKDFRCLDLCAAPGGKTFHAVDLTGFRGSFTALDKTEEKAEKIRENALRLHAAGIGNEKDSKDSGHDFLFTAGVSDASLFKEEFSEQFDLVICDVPCSGLGVIRKKPDILHHIDQKGLVELSKLQTRIADHAARYVKPGGTLLYSTCTIDPMENEEQYQAIRAHYPKLRPVDFSEQVFPVFRHSTISEGYLKLLPGIDPSDGFFIARFQKEK